MYEICDGDRELDEFLPAVVEVKACPRPPVRVWPPAAGVVEAVSLKLGGGAAVDEAHAGGEDGAGSQ